MFRDWGYAPEYIKAIWLMLQQEEPDDFIICSVETHGSDEFVKKVFEKLDLVLLLIRILSQRCIFSGL